MLEVGRRAAGPRRTHATVSAASGADGDGASKATQSKTKRSAGKGAGKKRMREEEDGEREEADGRQAALLNALKLLRQNEGEDADE